MDVPGHFRAAISRAGLTPPDEIQPDGELHRFPSNGKRGDSAGWYVVHGDGIPSGAFGCWRAGLTQSWRADVGRELTQTEREQQRQRTEEAKRKREQAEREEHAAAAIRAATEWGAATPATADHPYLKRKGVQPHKLRVDSSGRLLVPMRDGAGKLHSLQFIDGEGIKRFLPGGRVGGHYFAIGKPKKSLCVAEGFATAATIREATGNAVAVAFNAGNLVAVARTLREKFPKAELILCADDDVSTDGNPGVTKATEAADAVAGMIAVPDFRQERPDGASDFNDLAKHSGMEAVRRCIGSATRLGAKPWQDPLPLLAEMKPLDYPLDALPGAIGDAVREVAGFVQSPIPLAACSALSVLSLACQGLANIRRGSDLEGPLSLYLLTIAESGERKSATDKWFTEGVREWETRQLEMLKPDLETFRAAKATWEQTCEGIKQRIKQLSKDGESIDDARRELEQLFHEEPEPVRAPHLLLENETAENLAWRLAKSDGWPSAGILSSEAGVVFGGHAMRADSRMQSLSLLNKLWSGEDHRVGRRTSECFKVEGARLTMGLAVQPATVEAFFEDTGGLARDSGFAARFLIAWPATTQGTRLYREAPSGWPGLTAYRSRICALLDVPMAFNDSGGMKLATLDMDPEAFEVWRAFYNGVETELRADGELAEVRDVASKTAENCARVAGLFHLFEHGPAGRVGPSHIESAARIVTWHLAESKRFLGGLTLSKPIANALKLDRWLIAVGKDRGVDRFTKREIMNRGPNAVRRKDDLQAALAELVDAKRARTDDDGRAIELNPALLRP